jgi:cephalosporin hydroxylase
MDTLHNINEHLKAQYGETSLDFTDKGAASGHSYIEFYSKHMDPKQANAKLLEVGISSGGSALLWSSYFVDYEIHGFDYLPTFASKTPFQQQLLDNSKIKLTFDKSSFDPNWANTFTNEYFDFIIDDGDHSPQGQWKTFQLYYSKLAKGGVYFVEDVMNATTAEDLEHHLTEYLSATGEPFEIGTYVGWRTTEGRHDDVIIYIKKL